MNQITLREPYQFETSEAPIPQPTAGEALVRVHRIGICGTDLHAYTGNQNFFTYPRVCGHELGVEIVEIPENSRGLAAGDTCTIEPYLTCGKCPVCRKGKSNCCENIQVLGVHADGGMRDYFCVPIPTLFKSESLTHDQLALIEPLSISDHAVIRSNLQAGESVLVIGVGPIGLGAVQFALAAGAEVTVLELNEARCTFVSEATGVRAVNQMEGETFDVVFDATGNVHAMEAAFEKVGFGGRLVFIGHTKGAIQFHNPLFHSREMTVLASRNSTGRFPAIIQMIESGKIDTNPWITHRLKLENVPTEFAQLESSPGLVKAIVEVDAE